MLKIVFCIVSFSSGLFALLYLLLHRIFRNNLVRKKLILYEKKIKIESKRKPIKLSAAFTPIKNKIMLFTSDKLKSRLEGIIKLSGKNLELSDLLLLKLMVSVIFMLTGFIFLKIIDSLIINLLLIIFFTFSGFNMPDFILEKTGKKRQKLIINSLPAFLDYLTVSVEAGLGLDSSIYKVLKYFHGPLADEISFTMSEIKYGKTKREAFKNMTLRLNIPELTSFINTLINAEQMGISLGNILKIQGTQIREKKKQRIEEAAYKVSIKLLFPLVIFILPGLFIVLLGPAAIQVINIFIK